MTLLEIIAFHNIDGFDKPGGTDKNTIHSYIDSYEKLLSPFKNRKCTLLEIGIQYGGSSLLWHDYLPNAKLSFIDFRPECIHPSLIPKFDMSRSIFYSLDAYSNDTVAILSKNNPDGFDIIIDDGPHTFESFSSTITKYLPLMNSGGIIIMEDLPYNFATETPFGFYLEDKEFVNNLISLVPEYLRKNVELIDLTHVKGRYDDILLTITLP